MNNVFYELQARGFIQQLTHPDETEHLFANESVTCYVGIDPTANSLHVGHLLPLMMMMHLQKAGHRPLIIVGGGTVMVGDPSGKTEMRSLITTDVINENKKGIKAQISKLLDFSEGKALMLDNADWLLSLNYIDFLREIGSHFSVNRMLAADAYKARMERPESGLSFIELNYMIMQSYDFLVLNRNYGCKVQIGGDDQWSNIISGADLIRRVDHDRAYGMTLPLLVTGNGHKMGKTEAGAVWLDPEKTSPYEFYQFWRNVHDGDVKRFLAFYTLLPISEIDRLTSVKGSAINETKKVLAFEVTKLIHGELAAQEAAASAEALFGEGKSGSLMPTTYISENDLAGGLLILDVLVLSGLCASKSAARRLIQQNGLSINEEKIADLNRVLSVEDFVGGEVIVKKGRKEFHSLKLKS